MLPLDTTTRQVSPKDNMDSIYMMGFDVWRGAADRERYLRSCRESKKYQQGTWFVLDNGKTLVSSMIVYRGGFALPVKALGFGSLATHVQHRRQGYGSALLSAILSMQSSRSASAVYLHSDIASSFYENFGFISLREGAPGTKCMIRPGTVPLSTTPSIPNYF